MLTQKIKNQIEVIFRKTPSNIGVGFGKKIKKGKFTGQLSFIFFVEKKIPYRELSPREILPNEIFIDNEIYPTDVVEVGQVKTIQNLNLPFPDNYPCKDGTLADCYDWITNRLPTFYNLRPLRGGAAISSIKTQGSYGTLGFIALDSESKSLVGVTNNHVIIGNAFNTSVRYVPGPLENEITNVVYQPWNSIYNQADALGKVVRYVPIDGFQPFSYTNNKVDGAIFSISASSVDNQSYEIYGLTGWTGPMEFATTQELDNLMIDNPPLISVGATTNVKEGIPCGLEMYAMNVYLPVGGYLGQGYQTAVFFKEQIMYTKRDFNLEQCPYPIFPGDSGSALIANYNGTYKIIGLNFAGTDDPLAYFGFANRIDNVATQLNIEAWTGGTVNYINPESIQIVTITGTTSASTLSCDNKTYWQFGMTSFSNPC